MALTDRHFIAKHFNILFAIFGLVVQKLCQFKVYIHFLLIVLIPGICSETFYTRPGASHRDRRVGQAATLACHVGQRPTRRFDRRERPGPARAGTVTGGAAVDRFVASGHEGSREEAHYAQEREGSLAAAARDLLVTGGSPATSYGGGPISA